MPIYRNKETGYEVEVMSGTRLPKVYEKVEKRSAKSKDDKATQTKDASAKTPAKGKNAKTAAKSSKGVKEGKDEVPAADVKSTKNQE